MSDHVVVSDCCKAEIAPMYKPGCAFFGAACTECGAPCEPVEPRKKMDEDDE